MSTAETTTPTGTWTVDKVHSQAAFEVKHNVIATFRAEVEDFDATLTFEDGEPKLVGTARPASIKVRDENLAAHLASEEFFHTERYPEIRFESTSVRRDGDAVTVEGDLTIKGVTKRVEAKGTLVGPTDDAFGGVRIGLDLETVVDRTEFGLNWNMPLPKGGFVLANDVKLVLHLEFVSAS